MDSTAVPSSGRNRACDTCRRRKVKCSSHFNGVCGNCRQYNVPCTYQFRKPFRHQIEKSSTISCKSQEPAPTNGHSRKRIRPDKPHPAKLLPPPPAPPICASAQKGTGFTCPFISLNQKIVSNVAPVQPSLRGILTKPEAIWGLWQVYQERLQPFLPLFNSEHLERDLQEYCYKSACLDQDEDLDIYQKSDSETLYFYLLMTAFLGLASEEKVYTEVYSEKKSTPFPFPPPPSSSSFPSTTTSLTTTTTTLQKSATAEPVILPRLPLFLKNAVSNDTLIVEAGFEEESLIELSTKLLQSCYSQIHLKIAQTQLLFSIYYFPGSTSWMYSGMAGRICQELRLQVSKQKRGDYIYSERLSINYEEQEALELTWSAFATMDLLNDVMMDHSWPDGSAIGAKVKPEQIETALRTLDHQEMSDAEKLQLSVKTLYLVWHLREESIRPSFLTIKSDSDVDQDCFLNKSKAATSTTTTTTTGVLESRINKLDFTISSFLERYSRKKPELLSSSESKSITNVSSLLVEMILNTARILLFRPRSVPNQAEASKVYSYFEYETQGFHFAALDRKKCTEAAIQVTRLADHVLRKGPPTFLQPLVTYCLTMACVVHTFDWLFAMPNRSMMLVSAGGAQGELETWQKQELSRWFASKTNELVAKQCAVKTVRARRLNWCVNALSETISRARMMLVSIERQTLQAKHNSTLEVLFKQEETTPTISSASSVPPSLAGILNATNEETVSPSMAAAQFMSSAEMDKFIFQQAGAQFWRAPTSVVQEEWDAYLMNLSSNPSNRR